MELIQDRYTNLILYDSSERCDPRVDYIPLIDVTGVEITFKETSDNIEEDKHFIVDDTQKAKLKAIHDYEGYDFSAYIANKSASFIINNVDIEVEMVENLPDIGHLVSEMQQQLGESVLVGNLENRLTIETIDTGADTFIHVVGGDLLDIIGLEIGVHRGNSIPWGDVDITQGDLQFTFYPEDLGFSVDVPIGKLDVQVVTSYGSYYTYVDDYEEYCYKQIEMWRALYLENIALNFNEFTKIEERVYTETEVSMESFIIFDSVLKAFLSAIEVGNSLVASKLLVYLENYIELHEL